MRTRSFVSTPKGFTVESEDIATVRVRIDLSYDGTRFVGWAFQPGQRTVAGVLDQALLRLFTGPLRLTVAGRTDSGVHAVGQVAHVDVHEHEWRRHERRVLWRLRGILPEDVRVRGAYVVPPEFNARFSALGRRYEYRVADAEWGVDPLRRHDTLAYSRRLDVDAMNEAATYLLGEHDFAAFCKRREGATTIRALRHVGWRREPDGVAVATVIADAFCHSMVRSLVGAMLAVGEGQQEPAWLGQLLRLRQRAGNVKVAAAHGLTLAGVEYPRDAEALAARQAETRRIRTLSGSDAP
ncbi:MAG TPA: tRNA pseudouridine(38-40) synthase TruA [Candidatus Stackebrandtia faecavium]|nr:tRNA pseudouridine(38-40) synthase TruA [Candidatus Stackebrandtia faecavium]